VIDGVSLSAVEGTHESEFLSGVIEGFYGKPWTPAERIELFGWMARWGLNTYFYAPKDDLHHRALWREPYGTEDAGELAHLVEACRQRNIHFVYALSPGLDIRYREETELDRLYARFEQMLAMGCEHFSLLFDDIPDHLESQDIARWGSLASAQCHVANAVFTWTRRRVSRAESKGVREPRFIVCPTAYCGSMARRNLGGEGYLATMGRELSPEIDVLWTGPNIISREITVAHVRELQEVLRRKPLIWDNLHANDYDGRRFFCGPYSGRPPELRRLVAGLLSNPNNEFLLNYVPLRTLAEFARSDGTWNPRTSYLAAMHDWLPWFATVGRPIVLEDFILFGDCYYLPHEDGPEGEAVYECARGLVAGDSAKWDDDAATFRQRANRLREVCVQITELRHRPLFHALSRRIWDLREQLDLVERYLDFKSGQATDFLLPATERGGMAARLQNLVRQHAGAQ
jgi:protein O-GlcNAcase/histone acetyltransferase